MNKEKAAEDFTKSIKKIKETSLFEKILQKKGALHKKELAKLKNESLKKGALIGIIISLAIGFFTKNILLSFGIGSAACCVIFVLLLQAPLAKKRAYAKRVEMDLPFFLMRLATELRIGKSISKAIKDSCKEEGFASKEFEIILSDMNKGASFSDALEGLNQRIGSLAIRRVASNLSNLSAHGTKDTLGIKKIAEDLLARQRIESKEFSGKMVVYSLVFIAVSAIVPAMFQSFTLIGSYFMSLSFSAQQALIISTVVFPAIDLAILALINSKTPLFLRQ